MCTLTVSGSGGIWCRIHVFQAAGAKFPQLSFRMSPSNSLWASIMLGTTERLLEYKRRWKTEVFDGISILVSKWRVSHTPQNITLCSWKVASETRISTNEMKWMSSLLENGYPVLRFCGCSVHVCKTMGLLRYNQSSARDLTKIVKNFFHLSTSL